MEEGASYVHVVLLTLHQQYDGQAVDEDSYTSRPRYDCPVDLSRLIELMIALDEDAADSHEQEDGVDE